MEFSWTTFVIEIVNFVILVWILKRFFYKPVLDVIKRRRAGIDQTLAQAKSIHDEAETIQKQYEGRLADWEREKKTAYDQLQDELDRERTKQLEALRATLDEEREKARVLEQRRGEDMRQRQEQLAMRQGAQFTSRLLQRFAAPELEARLVDLTAADLASLVPERLEALRDAFAELDRPVTITSAYPLATAQRETIETALGHALQTDKLECRFEENPELIAGLRISLGPWMLRANLQDELEFFVGSAHA